MLVSCNKNTCVIACVCLCCERVFTCGYFLCRRFLREEVWWSRWAVLGDLGWECVSESVARAHMSSLHVLVAM